jgi:hypothetical protein
MGLTDMIAEMVIKLTSYYKHEYKDDEFEFQKTFKKMIFHMLKSLYILQLPEYKEVLLKQIPSNTWIKNHIDSLLEPEDEICPCCGKS